MQLHYRKEENTDHLTDLCCPFCNSPRVIKHGHTPTNNPRYRCRYCKRTWVQSKFAKKTPNCSALAEAYLEGSSYRDLRSICQSSPIRINQKIREYLLGCANWEAYLDACTPKHEARLIHLVGKKFKCTYGNNKEHTMFVAFAIDALSTVVLGYEIGERETRDLWLFLLDRLNCRGILCPTFMSYGTRIVNESVQVVFPYSSTINNFTRAFYDKRLKNRVFHSVNIRDLLIEAINAYEANRNHNLKNYLVIFKDKRMKNLVLSSEDKFFDRLKDRIISKKSTSRFEGLCAEFQKRFQKFHMIKYDPVPIINGWIGYWMLNPLPFGFSRLSLYLQQPCKTRFNLLNCGTKPFQCNLDLDSPEMKSFLIELAVRSLHVPVSQKIL